MRVNSLPRPGETVLAPTYDAVPGGKGANQAVAAARAGAATHMIGCVGGDGFAAVVLESLNEAGVDLGAVARVATPTACAMICVDDAGRNQIAVASGANLETRASQLDDALLGLDTTLVLQLEIDADETWTVVRRARALGARVVLNTAPAAAVPPETAKACTVHIMNEIEAVMMAQAAGLAETDPVAAARGIAEAWGAATVVTLGGGGACAFDRGVAVREDCVPIDEVVVVFQPAHGTKRPATLCDCENDWIATDALVIMNS